MVDGRLQSLFEQQPHECALVIVHTVRIGAVIFLLLVGHSAWLLYRLRSSPHRVDGWLQVSLLVRVTAAIPRLVFWYQMVKLYNGARLEPTPQLVAAQLCAIHESWLVRTNARFSRFFHVWLGANLTASWWFLQAGGQLSWPVFLHCWYNVAAIIIVKVLTVFLFFFLVNYGVDKGLHPCVLDAHTKLRDGVASEEQCSICCTEFRADSPVRELACGHWFHKPCIDTWLVKYSTKCPLCMNPVGPKAGHAKAD